jgi:hypothetical protein
MKAPRPKFIWKKPFAVQCPACSVVFEITSYTGTGDEKVAQMKAAYEEDFRATHASEVGS